MQCLVVLIGNNDHIVNLQRGNRTKQIGHHQIDPQLIIILGQKHPRQDGRRHNSDELTQSRRRRQNKKVPEKCALGISAIIFSYHGKMQLQAAGAPTRSSFIKYNDHS